MFYLLFYGKWHCNKISFEDLTYNVSFASVYGVSVAGVCLVIKRLEIKSAHGLFCYEDEHFISHLCLRHAPA